MTYVFYIHLQLSKFYKNILVCRANAVEDMVFWSIIIIYLMSRFAKRGKSGISKNISMNPFVSCT